MPRWKTWWLKDLELKWEIFIFTLGFFPLFSIPTILAPQGPNSKGRTPVPSTLGVIRLSLLLLLFCGEKQEGSFLALYYGLNCTSPPHEFSLQGPQIVTLFENRVISICLVKMRSCWSRIGPNPTWLVALIQKEGHIEEKKTCADRKWCEMWRHKENTAYKKCQRLLTNYQKPGGENRFSLTALTRNQPCHHFDFYF